MSQVRQESRGREYEERIGRFGVWLPVNRDSFSSIRQSCLLRHLLDINAPVPGSDPRLSSLRSLTPHTAHLLSPTTDLVGPFDTALLYVHRKIFVQSAALHDTSHSPSLGQLELVPMISASFDMPTQGHSAPRHTGPPATSLLALAYARAVRATTRGA